MTSYEKILETMAAAPSNKWFFPYEFMKPELGHLFVGYKAPTRINELESKYPSIFERELKDKFIIRRLNRKDVKDWWEILPPDLKKAIHRGRNRAV